MPIPLSRPDITQLEIDAVSDVLRSDTLSIGPQIEAFEAAVAKVANRKFGVGVNSGTSGLHLAMLAAGIGPGDEVITTPFSFVASTNCILYVGAKPVFVDIDIKTLNMDVSRVAAAITPKTKAIVGVEVFGHPGGMAELEALCKRHDLILIEDCCEGFGGASGNRPIGNFGLGGVFAFYPNKQITTGEGGMIVTDDAAFAQKCRALRNQGREGMAWLAHQMMGFNFRLSEINAALGVVQVSRLPEILDRRRIVASWYVDCLMTSPYLILPTISASVDMSWFVFVVRLNDTFTHSDRDSVMRKLRAKGIGCNNYFPPIHLQPYIVESLGTRDGMFPVTEYVSNRTLALPFFTTMTRAQVQEVCEVLEAVLEEH